MNPKPQKHTNSTPNGVGPALLPQTPSPLYVGAGVLGLVWNYSLTFTETTITHRATHFARSKPASRTVQGVSLHRFSNR
jgi:hypothetical protein